jgi:hypothetical protein
MGVATDFVFILGGSAFGVGLRAPPQIAFQKEQQFPLSLGAVATAFF